MSTQFAFTNDDAGTGGAELVESFRRTCAYLESRGLRGTWFVVPKPRGDALSEEWKNALRAGRDAGHDLQLHGLTHGDCYEFGPPVQPAITILSQLATNYQDRRAELESRYTVENLRTRIEEGIEIFQRELDVTPTVFRAPCGAISEAMFEALNQAGIRYETSQYINMGEYHHVHNRPPAQEWTDLWPHRPFRWTGGVVEAPILGEYTWRGASGWAEAFLTLAKDDCDRIVQESSVAVILSHTHGIASDYDYAFRTFDAIFEYIAAHGGSMTTMGVLAQSGALDRAADATGPVTVSIPNWWETLVTPV